jgi:hypothetical protein
MPRIQILALAVILAPVTLRTTFMALIVVMKQYRMAITSTTWSTVTCTILMTATAIITAKWKSCDRKDESPNGHLPIASDGMKAG